MWLQKSTFAVYVARVTCLTMAVIRCTTAAIPSIMQLQPMFFDGIPYFGIPVGTPNAFAPYPVYNISDTYQAPLNMTLNIPGYSPFMVSNPYGYYMPPVVVVYNENATTTTRPTTTTQRTSTTTRVPVTVFAPPGLGGRFFTKSLWKKPK